MSSIVLVLIAAPGALHAPVIGEIVEEVRALGGTSVTPIPLAPVEACEFELEGLGLGAIRLLRETIAARHPTLDVCTVPALHRRKQLLIADMDSTIIQQECIDEMADMLGLKPQIAAITERAMRGELKFEDALRERLGLLAGITEGQLEEVFQTRLTLMPGARTLVATMKAHGATAALVSGGFTFFTARIARLVGFNENQANTLDMVDGRLTGQVIGPILGKEAKLAALEHYARGLEIDLAETLAVGDGANDLDMIRAAGLGVAYRAKPIVAADADAAITNGDLTALLYLQGYSQDEFVTD
jgi:phosphoserine phosphatase